METISTQTTKETFPTSLDGWYQKRASEEYNIYPYCKLVSSLKDQLSRRMRKQTICIGENKGADQLRGNCEADQRLCFRYTDSTIPLLSKSKLSSL